MPAIETSLAYTVIKIILNSLANTKWEQFPNLATQILGRCNNERAEFQKREMGMLAPLGLPVARGLAAVTSKSYLGSTVTFTEQPEDCPAPLSMRTVST